MISSNIYKKIAGIAIFLIVFLSGLPGHAQTRDDMINTGIDHIYNLRFDQAETEFKNMINQDPTDPTGYFFIAMKEWWRVNVTREGNAEDEKYLEAVNKAIEVCDQRLDKNEKDDWALFLKGGLLGYRGFMWSMNENWLRAADDAREGLALIERSIEVNPGNKDAIFGIGLYNYGVDHVFSTNPLLKTLLFFFKSGNKQLGLSQIIDCADNGKYSRVEANFVLAYINLVYEKNFGQSFKYANFLYERYPNNPVFHKYLGRSFVGQGRWGESLATWKNIMGRADSNIYGYNTKIMKREAFYYLGLTNQRINQNDDAVYNYSKSLELSNDIDKDKESQYRVFSTLGIALAYEQKGEKEQALNWFRKVVDMKNYENSRSSAQSYIDKLSK